MIEDIKKNLLEISSFPNLKYKKIPTNVDNQMIIDFIKSIDAEFDTNKFKLLTEREDFFLTSENLSILKQIKDRIISVDIDNLENNMFNSSMIPHKDIWIEYHQFAKMLNNEIIKIKFLDIDIYTKGQTSFWLQDDIIDNIIKKYDKEVNINSNDININEITYSKFENMRFVRNLISPLLKYSTNILYTNMDYETYSLHPVLKYVNNFNLNKDEQMFLDTPKNEFLKLVENISVNGISEPILMNISNGIISIPYTKDILNIYIAKLLQIPSVPVMITISIEYPLNNKILNMITLYDNNLEFFYNGISNNINPYLMLVKKDTNTEKDSDYIEINNIEDSLYKTLIIGEDDVKYATISQNEKNRILGILNS